MRKVPQIFVLHVGLAKKFAFPLRSIIFVLLWSHSSCCLVEFDTRAVVTIQSLWGCSCRGHKRWNFLYVSRMHLSPSMVLKFLYGLISIYKELLRMLWFLWESIRRRQLDVPLLQDSFCSEVYSCFFEPYWCLFVVPVGNDEEKLWFMNCIFLNMSWGKCYNYFYFVFLVGRVNILCVQETKWKGQKAKEVDNTSFKLWYTGKTSNKNGVGVLIDKSLKDGVEVRRQGDRIILVKLVISDIFLNVISAYAPSRPWWEC